MQTDRQPQGTGLRLKMAGFRSYFENNTFLQDALFSKTEQKIGPKRPGPDASGYRRRTFALVAW